MREAAVSVKCFCIGNVMCLAKVAKETKGESCFTFPLVESLED